MFELLRGGSLILAVITMGLMSGIFQLYSHTVMPGLAKTDDRTFGAAFQAMDRAIMNPLFLATFVGPLVFSGLATALSLGPASRSLLPWPAVALVLYLIVMVITIRINVPLNDALKAATDPDLGAVRARFNETLWVRWNHVRSWLSTAGFVCLAWGSVVYGKLL